MNYNKNRICQFESHEGNPILGFCISSNCKFRAYCHDCISEYHSQHLDKLKQYKKFDIWLKDQQSFLQEVQQTIDYLHELANIFLQIQILYRNLNNNEQSEMKFSEFNAMIDKLIKLADLKEIIQSKQSLIKQDYEQNFWKALMFLKTLKQIFDPDEQELMIQNLHQPQKNSLVDELVPECDRWFFQQSSQLVYTSEEFENFVFEPKISVDKNSVICLEILEGSFAYLGVCDQTLISRDNFNKGYYLIGCNGFSYSHSTKELNCVRQDFTFNDTQVIFIIIDQKQKQIIFEKLEMPFYPNHAHVVDMFKMPFDNTLELNYCVYLQGTLRILTEKDFLVDFDLIQKELTNNVQKEKNKEDQFATNTTDVTQQTQQPLEPQNADDQ